MENEALVRHLQSIIEISKVLAQSGDTVVAPWARQILTCAYTALQAKSPATAIGDLIEFE